MELRAPRSGVVRGLARQARVGQAWAAPRDKDQTFCILEPRRLRVLLPVPPADYRLLQQDLEKSPNLEVTILVQGLGDISWRGRVGTLPQAEAKSVPPALTAKFGGPLAVKPGANPNVQAPQSQQYLVPIDFLDADQTICPGTLAQVKVHCRWRTCAWWVWRTVSSAFDIGLI